MKLSLPPKKTQTIDQDQLGGGFAQQVAFELLGGFKVVDCACDSVLTSKPLVCNCVDLSHPLVATLWRDAVCISGNARQWKCDPKSL